MTHAAKHDAASDHSWNPNDPHGAHAHEHGHVVVSWKLQLGVLAALLFFTGLTVLFFNAEQWAEEAFLIHLPGWVNIVGAMSIASIKATLVCMFFMQLRYDKPLNTFALLFCLFGVGLFLFFSMLDLSTRGWVNSFKYGEITDATGNGPGGTGVGLEAEPRSKRFDARISPRVQTGGRNLVTVRREQDMARWAEKHPGAPIGEWWAEQYHHLKHPHRHPADTENYFAQYGFDHNGPDLSSADRRVVITGRTTALDLAVHSAHGASHEAGHEADHGAHDADAHSQDDHAPAAEH